MFYIFQINSLLFCKEICIYEKKVLLLLIRVCINLVIQVSQAPQGRCNRYPDVDEATAKQILANVQLIPLKK